MTYHGIDIPEDKIAAFCRKHGIRRLSLFGSILRDDFGPDSDIDVLVEFEPGARRGLFRIAGMEIELSKLFDRKADINTVGLLGRRFRDEVVGEAEVQYDAA